MRAATRFLSLSAAERNRALEAALYLLVVRLIFGVLPFARALRLLAISRAEEGSGRSAAAEKRASPQSRVAFSQGHHFPHETQEIGILGGQAPIDPAHFVILTPGVIVPSLRTEELIAGQEHRHALGDQQGNDEVLGLPQAQAQHFRIVFHNKYVRK